MIAEVNQDWLDAFGRFNKSKREYADVTREEEAVLSRTGLQTVDEELEDIARASQQMAKKRFVLTNVKKPQGTKGLHFGLGADEVEEKAGAGEEGASGTSMAPSAALLLPGGSGRILVADSKFGMTVLNRDGSTAFQLKANSFRWGGRNYDRYQHLFSLCPPETLTGVTVGFAADYESENVYIVSPHRHTVSCMNLRMQTFSVLAGSNSTSEQIPADGKGHVDSATTTDARLHTPTSCALLGNKLLVADTGNDCIRLLDLSTFQGFGMITVLGKPSTKRGKSPTGSTAAKDMRFNAPKSVSVAPDGTIWIAESKKIFRWAKHGLDKNPPRPSGVVELVAGNDKASTKVVDGKGDKASFGGIRGSMFHDHESGAVFVTDMSAPAIRRVRSLQGAWTVDTVVAGNKSDSKKSIDGIVAPDVKEKGFMSASVVTPIGISAGEDSGELLVCERIPGLIRRLYQPKRVTAIAEESIARSASRARIRDTKDVALCEMSLMLLKGHAVATTLNVAEQTTRSTALSMTFELEQARVFEAWTDIDLSTASDASTSALSLSSLANLAQSVLVGTEPMTLNQRFLEESIHRAPSLQSIFDLFTSLCLRSHVTADGRPTSDEEQAFVMQTIDNVRGKVFDKVSKYSWPLDVASLRKDVKSLETLTRTAGPSVVYPDIVAFLFSETNSYEPLLKIWPDVFKAIDAVLEPLNYSFAGKR